MRFQAPFIVLEGPEGAGKSIQATFLTEWMRSIGWQVIQTREPGGTPAGDVIRSLLLQSDHLQLAARTEALLMSAARAQHVHERILPALLSGTAVVCDRYVDSTYAYQGAGLGLSMDDLKAVQAFATESLEPDIRLLLDLPVETGLQRRRGEREQVNRIDRAPLTFHQRVRDGYLALVAANNDAWDVVDASQPIESVRYDIQRAVLSHLKDWPCPDMVLGREEQL